MPRAKLLKESEEGCSACIKLKKETDDAQKEQQKRGLSLDRGQRFLEISAGVFPYVRPS